MYSKKEFMKISKFEASQRLMKGNTSNLILILLLFELFKQMKIQQLMTINLQIFPKIIGNVYLILELG